MNEALQLLDTRDEQIDAVRNGEEEPREQGLDELSRARTRRADIVCRVTSK